MTTYRPHPEGYFDGFTISADLKYCMGYGVHRYQVVIAIQ